MIWKREKQSSCERRVISTERQEKKSNNLSLETLEDSRGNKGGVTLPGLGDDNVHGLSEAGRAQKVTKTSWTMQDWRQGSVCKAQ